MEKSGRVAASPTQIKSESKMDVNIGDKVTIEGTIEAVSGASKLLRVSLSGDAPTETYVWMRPDQIKSVEPAPPAVGDTVSFNRGNCTNTIVAISKAGEYLFQGYKGEFIIIDAKQYSDFKVTKRAEPK